MFQSYIYKGTLHIDRTLEIIDSDFVVSKPINLRVNVIQEIFEFIEKTYEERKLPVTPNLIRAMLFFIGDSKGSFRFWVSNITLFAKYEKDIDKYLMLL